MPKHTSITDAAAKKFTSKEGRVDHFDSSATQALALRVSATGVKAWTYFYRLVNGHVQQRRMTLGLYPAMSVRKLTMLGDALAIWCKPVVTHRPSPTTRCQPRASRA